MAPLQEEDAEHDAQERDALNAARAAARPTLMPSHFRTSSILTPVSHLGRTSESLPLRAITAVGSI